MAGWDPPHIARAWIVLMKRLGYTRFVAQGGDWGSPVSNEMGKLAPPELLGIHVNLPGVVPPEIFKALDKLGWTDWVACEYRARARTEDGLGWARPDGGVPKA